MKKKILVLSLLTLMGLFSFLPHALAQADGEAKIEKMNIAVMPEYDDPRVLAILEPVLTADTKLPLTAKFYIPKSATSIQVGMACEVPEGGGHQCKPYDTVDKGDFTELSYNVTNSRNLFFEYYWDPFKGATGNKSFDFEYRPPYEIKRLEVQIQQPLKATDFKVEPASTNISSDAQGFKYYTYTFDNVPKDRNVNFKVSYAKSDNNPSVKKTVGADNPNQGGQPAETQASTGTVRLMVFAAILVIIGGTFLSYWRIKAVGATATKAKPVASRVKVKSAKVAQSSAKFCSNCGSQIQKSDKFCPNCGTKVR